MIIVKGNIFRTFLVISLIVDCSSSPAYHYLTDKLTWCFSGFMMRYETNWIILTWMLQKQLKISAVQRMINTGSTKPEVQNRKRKAEVRQEIGQEIGQEVRCLPSFSFNMINAKTYSAFQSKACHLYTKIAKTLKIGGHFCYLKLIWPSH